MAATKIRVTGILPKKAHTDDAAYDLVSNMEESVTLWPRDIKLIKTGTFIELPFNYEAQIRPRSGLALKKGITVFNSPGTVDAKRIW